MTSPAALALSAAFGQLDQSPNSVEPEAQLTRPVADFLEAFVSELALGTLLLQREAQLPGVRPDFAALIDGRPCGWVELKAPGHSLDGSSWRGRERQQWERLSELDSLLVTDGQNLRLYRLGEQIDDEAQLPASTPDDWDPRGVERLIRQFLAMRPPVIRTVHQLAERLAPMAKLLRERVAVGLRAETREPLIAQAKAAWTANVHEGVSDAAFASDLAQVVSYSLAIAGLSGIADADGDGFISLSEARSSLRSSNAVLAAALGPVLDAAGLSAKLSAEIGAIERLVSALDPRAVAASQDSRGEPWLWFYEDFLAAYDPVARARAGVYYTPTSVVQMQVRHVDWIIRNEFEKPLGFADANVVTLDPATGSGTYPLAVLDKAAEAAITERGPAGPRQVVQHLVSNVLAFELLPGPYAVAHLRIGRRLAELGDALVPPGNVRVYLTDTLDDPTNVPTQLPLWGDMQVLADERERARTVKYDQAVTAIIGNPPYERGTGDDGGWVTRPGNGQRALFADVIEAAQSAGIIFSEQASLYNQYVYFWRWALWKAFEQDQDRPAVVSFITAKSWVNNPVFLGLRQLASRHADEIWVTDLGGEGRGNDADDNVFAIQTPVAIVTLFRRGSSTASPAKVSYVRVSGTKAEKLATLDQLGVPTTSVGEWISHAPSPADGFAPTPDPTVWETYPLITQIFPWQQPGLMINRSWPVSPDPDVLRNRWAHLLAATDSTTRAERLVTASTGRNIQTQVSGLPRLSELPPNARPREVVRYSYRSFDREWILNDPRIINLERPALWSTMSDRQVFLSTMTRSVLGDGPALTVATSPPDKHHFRGNFGGKDVIPLYRDAAALSPNVADGLLERLPTIDGASATVEDLVAYVYAILAHPGYVRRFRAELNVAGPRVPLTLDPDLFSEGRDLGARLLWLHTFAERFTSSDRSGAIPRAAGIGWVSPTTRLPRDGDVDYDAESRTLAIADGVITGVEPEVWAYSVSRWPVLRRWIEARSLLGRGKARTNPTPLDRIRSTEWLDVWNDELLDLVLILNETIAAQAQQESLLDRVVNHPLLSHSVGVGWDSRSEPDGESGFEGDENSAG